MADNVLNIEKIKNDARDHALRHIAFIMDGNGRWAKKRGMPREYGHKVGAEAFRRVLEACNKLDIQCVTVYAFSTENWKRPKREVDSIMKLLEEYLEKSCPDNLSVRVIGDISALDERLVNKIEQIQRDTAGREKIVNIAINYGSRAEIVHAVNELIKDGKSDITDEDITSKLYTADCPELDLIVRTGGDLRISNFLLWQAAYAELYFTETLWPDMSEREVAEAVLSFNSRKRRYGGLDK